MINPQNDSYLKISSHLGKKRSFENTVSLITETILHIEKDLRRNLNEDEMCHIVEYILAEKEK
jgi:hypothetical protein